MEIKQTNIDLTELENACNLPHWQNRKLTFAAFDEDKPIGFVSADFVLDECSIYDVGVLPQYRKKGIAIALISHLICECKARNFSFITLEVRSENTPAINLYEKCGFALVYKRKNYYKNPDDDALIYTLNLRGEK